MGPVMGKRFLITLLLLAAVTGTGITIAFTEPVEQVETVRVERGDLELTIRVTGEVINDRRVTLTALVDGQVVALNAAMGDRVEAGQVLASMDNRAAAARQQRAQAYLQQVEVQLQQAERHYRRMRTLAQTESVSLEGLEEARLNWEAASAMREVARADLRLAQVETEWQQVRAPFGAVVVDKSTERGQWVEAGTQLFTLVALDNLEIEAHVDAVDSARVRLGQRVEVRCDAFPEQAWHSTLNWIGPSVEREKDARLNTFRVRLGLGEPPAELLIGQQVDLEIQVDRREAVLTLPFSALGERNGTYEVGLIEAGRLRYQAVETGLEGDSRVELLSELTEGARVISLEADAPEAGSRVEAAP
jgi:RND family efflux transporter MFP subunit